MLQGGSRHRGTHLLPPLALSRAGLIRRLPAARSTHRLRFVGWYGSLVVHYVLGGLGGCRHRILQCGFLFLSFEVALEPLGQFSELGVTDRMRTVDEELAGLGSDLRPSCDLDGLSLTPDTGGVLRLSLGRDRLDTLHLPIY